jgi:hypothetical protein
MDRAVSMIEQKDRRRWLERKLRATWLANAAAEWERGTGERPTADELRAIVSLYDWSKPESP